MTARVVEFDTTVPRPYLAAGQSAHGYAATCADHDPAWVGPAHLIGWESAPNAAARFDADMHDLDAHEPAARRDHP